MNEDREKKKTRQRGKKVDATGFEPATYRSYKALMQSGRGNHSTTRPEI
jgi:hypothetical protein